MRPRNVLAGGLLVLTATLAGPAQAAVPDTWVRWAASPRDATVRSLDFLGTLYAGTEDDGVFAAPTSVGPWSQMNTGLEAPNADSIRQVKAAPSGILYAATSAGLFSSAAGGAWSPVGQGLGERRLNMGGIQSIMFNDPSGADMTVAVAGAAGPGVYSSSDFGAHWDKASGMPTGENVYHLTAHPAGTPMYAAADHGVYVSLDFGRSWTMMSDGIPPAETTLRVAVAPEDPTHLYASTASSVYAFDPQRLGWSKREGSDGQTLPAAGAKRAFILTPPLDGKFGNNRAVVGTESGVYATIDDGEHWRKMSGSTAAPDSATPMGSRIVWSLGLGFTTPTLMAGTAGFGVFSLPLQPIEAGTVTVVPNANLAVGKTLAASLSGWEGTRPFFYSYQWRKCEDFGGGCTPVAIPGETTATYTIPDEDANADMRYAVTVVGRNLVHPGSVTRTSAPVTASHGALPGTLPRPSFAGGPWLSPSSNQEPTPKWGQVYTINNGTWRTEGSSTVIAPTFDYRWMRCNGAGSACEAIEGANDATYATTPKDIGGRVAGYIRGTHNGVSGDWWLAGSSSTIVNKFPVNTAKPAIVGDPYAGVTLSSAAGAWDGHAMTYERRWYRCEASGVGCNPLAPNQTGATYQLGAADLGKRLQLRVTAVAADPNQPRKTVAESDLTAVITDPPPPPPPPPGPGGGDPSPGSGAPIPGNGSALAPPSVKIAKPKSLKPGTRLRVPKTFAGFVSPTYRWLRNGKQIKGASRRAYRIKRKDRGKRLACRITLRPAAGGATVVVKTKPVKIPRKR